MYEEDSYSSRTATSLATSVRFSVNWSFWSRCSNPYIKLDIVIRSREAVGIKPVMLSMSTWLCVLRGFMPVAHAAQR